MSATEGNAALDGGSGRPHTVVRALCLRWDGVSDRLTSGPPEEVPLSASQLCAETVSGGTKGHDSAAEAAFLAAEVRLDTR